MISYEYFACRSEPMSRIEGLGKDRSEVIRRAVEYLAKSSERAQIGVSIADSYRARPQTLDEDAQAMANAIAMTEAEPW